MIYIPDHNILFIRVPKTGSTAIAQFLIDNFDAPNVIVSNVIYKNWPNFEKNIPPGHNNVYHMRLSYVEKHKLVYDYNLKKANIFAVLRNPLERILSQYIHRSTRNGYIEQGYNFNPSPMDFEKRILLYEGWTDQNDVGTFQHHYLENSSKLLTTFYPYEKINNLCDDLLNISFLKIPLKTVNVTNTPKPMSQLVEEYYSPKTLKLMNKVHGIDFIMHQEALEKQKC